MLSSSLVLSDSLIDAVRAVAVGVGWAPTTPPSWATHQEETANVRRMTTSDGDEEVEGLIFFSCFRCC